MQVKKFEAKSMKDALEMVKNQLGPDAIILAARDNNKGFGLMGRSSVEITAAISDTAMHKKKFAESRMTEKAKTQFRSSTARVQKQVVEKSVSRAQAQTPVNVTKRAPTQTQYADIIDEDDISQPDQVTILGKRVDTLLEKFQNSSELAQSGNEFEENQASKRIKNAAKSAAKTFEERVEQTVGRSTKEDLNEIRQLREENASLRRFIDQLQSLPRTFVNAHPGADLGISFDLSFMFEKLVAGGVANQIAADLMAQAARELPLEQQKNKNLIEAWTAHQIMNSIQVTDHSRLGRVHVFIGGSGQGKSASLVKLAGHLVSKLKKKILIVGVGNLRVGSHDQLRIFSHLLNSQFETVRTTGDWARVLQQHADVDYILADYPGQALRTDIEIASLKSLMPPFNDERRVHFVQSVLSKDTDASELCRRYLPIRPDDLIFTHLDESANHGLIYNLQKNFNLPLHSFGTGPSVPDDFEWASRERVLDLIFKLTREKL